LYSFFVKKITLHLSDLTLYQFKNYPSFSLQFAPKLTCLLGQNGVGKTNILDAIYVICLTKSAFQSSLAQAVLHQKEQMSIKAVFSQVEIGEKTEVLLSLDKQKKIIKVDHKEIESITDYIGRFSVVMIAPNDDQLIRESADVRRRFFDNTIVQANQSYLTALLQYNQILKNRNILLKNAFNAKCQPDQDLLAIYDEKMSHIGTQIYQIRKEFIAHFIKDFTRHYAHLCKNKEQPTIQYQTALDQNDLATILKANRREDYFAQRTTEGIHKDDFYFCLGDLALKKYGSQGQQKSFLIALKFAQFDYIHQKNANAPILLLDDIFDKLDDERIACLLSKISEGYFGQVVLTDARPERTKQLLSAYPSLDAAFVYL